MNIDEIKSQLKTEYPTLKRGSDEIGYTDIEPEEYEKIISDWADALYLEQIKAEQEAQAAAAKAAAEAKLAALGLTADDLKALGLGGN